jgi:uncharacterized membrane protein (DUF106 family)
VLFLVWVWEYKFDSVNITCYRYIIIITIIITLCRLLNKRIFEESDTMKNLNEFISEFNKTIMEFTISFIAGAILNQR